MVKARWRNEQEAGGRHHIYVEALDEDGQPLAGIPFRVMWPSGSADSATNGRSGFDAGNFPMSKSLHEFSVQMMPLLSDRVEGIGMGADGNSGIHTSTGLTFRRVTLPQKGLGNGDGAETTTGYVRVRDGAYIRSGSSTGDNILGLVPFGNAVAIVGYNPDHNWAHVQYNGVDGWMYSALISIEPMPAPTEPTPDHPAPSCDD